MFIIIAAWIYYFLLTILIGSGALQLIRRFSAVDRPFQFNIFYRFWFGFVILITLLQVFSLVLPINKIVFFSVTALALLVTVMNFKTIVNRLKQLYHIKYSTRQKFAALVAVLLILFVSYCANREVLHGDTLIYHYNAVKWVKEYSAVPGLANLHGRLGYNSSFFLFAALTETGFRSGESAHIAQSLLMLVCLLHWLFIIINPAQAMTKRIFCMLTAAFLVAHILSQIDVTSLSTDYPMAILTLVFCVILLDKINHKILLLLPIAATIFAMKLSGMLTIAVALLIMAGYYLHARHRHYNSKASFRVMGASFVLLCLVVAGFVARNIIVSGWLVYPFPIGNMHLPWSVPEIYVKDMMDWVKSYPKIPGGASPAVIHGNSFMFWFSQWYSQFRFTYEFNLLLISIFLLAWSAFQVRSITSFVYAHLNMIMLLFLGGASILFWFASAPEIRFGSIYFFIFFAATGVVLYEGSRYKNILKILVVGAFIFQVIHRVPILIIDRPPTLFNLAYTKPLKVKRVLGSPADEQPPLYLYMPVEGDACGNSPLPCTPYAGGFLQQHRLIRQRVPGDISKGFLPTE